jgi:hypothetical protein
MAKDYFPLRKGLKLDYRHKFGTAKPGKMRFEVISADEQPGSTSATCVRIFDGKPSPEYVMLKDEKKGWLSSSNWGKEFPLPPVVGKEWQRSPDLFRVEALDEEIETPAGKFTDCLKVVRLAAGGDAGTEERYYAEDVGLVYAFSNDESDPYELALTEGPIRIVGVPKTKPSKKS